MIIIEAMKDFYRSAIKDREGLKALLLSTLAIALISFVSNGISLVLVSSSPLFQLGDTLSQLNESTSDPLGTLGVLNATITEDVIAGFKSTIINLVILGQVTTFIVLILSTLFPAYIIYKKEFLNNRDFWVSRSVFAALPLTILSALMGIVVISTTLSAIDFFSGALKGGISVEDLLSNQGTDQASLLIIISLIIGGLLFAGYPARAILHPKENIYSLLRSQPSLILNAKYWRFLVVGLFINSIIVSAILSFIFLLFSFVLVLVPIATIPISYIMEGFIILAVSAISVFYAKRIGL